MTINEIKKELYRQKPIAKRTAEYPAFHSYQAELEDSKLVIFDVPLDEMGDTIFEEEMPAQLLIRWMI